MCSSDLFGPSLLVCPVYEYEARSREVYFPNTCGWYDFYTGKYIAGGQEMKVEAPYERIPLYVKAGAIIPYGPSIQYSNEKEASQITLYVYGGKDGEFKLYEDDGETYDYEKGQYARIPFKFDNKTQTLIIEKREGSFPGMLEQRTFNIVYVTSEKPIGYNPDAKGMLVKYDGKRMEVKL